MSFGAPLVLLALIALPVLAVWYLRQQGHRRAQAAAFARPLVQRNVAPRRPGFRRHAPYLVMALALAALIVAAARPQTTRAVEVERASIMLVTDNSGSMEATDVAPSRLAAVKTAAERFVTRVPARLNIGVLAFNQTPRVLQSPTTDRFDVTSAIERMSPSGGTATGDAIAQSLNILRHVPGELGRRPPAAIVLLSDGKSTSGRDPVAAARQARGLHIPIYTVALGTPNGRITVPRRGGGTHTVPVPPDPQTLAGIARASGGRAFTAQSASGLSQVYEKLGSQLGHKQEKRQITSAIAGGGLVLLLGAAALSLGWFGRLI